MDFNLDDPLGDLLSDGDGSEDSFAKILKQQRPAAPEASKSAKVSSLFGIAPTAEAAAPPAAKLPLPSVKKSPPESLFASAPPERTTKTPPKTPQRPTQQQRPTPAVRKEISFDVPKDDANDDDDDLFADLGFDPKKPKAAAGKKSGGFLDDLLGISDAPAKSAPSSRPTTGNRTPTAAATSATPPALSRQPSALTIQAPMTTLAPPPTQAPMGRPKTSANKRSEIPNDPLGLFSTPNSGPETKPATPSASGTGANSRSTSRKGSATVNWLDAEPSSKTAIGANARNEEPQPTTAAVAFTAATNPPAPSAVSSNLFQPTISQTAQLLAHTHADAGVAVQQLQQQEAQLLVAAQMRQQESALVDMQRRQHLMLQQQEQHFNELLRKQLHRQRNLEETIREQQGRINAHIDVLMQQPTGAAPITRPRKARKMPAATHSDDNQSDDDDTDDIPHRAAETPSGETLVELKVDIKRLEMENLRLADLCEHSKENHDRELELMEQSHRKQTELMEQSAELTEKRLRTEMTAQAEFYATKLALADTTNAAAAASFDARLAKETAEAAAALDALKTRHAAELQQLHADHEAAIANIRRVRTLEFTALQENCSYVQTLQVASGHLETANGDLQTLRRDFEQRIQRSSDERDAQLAAREQRLTAQLADYERQRTATEAERSALVDLVRTLETKLQTAQQQQDEEQWTQRQQRAVLDAERAAFERERASVRERQDRDEARAKEQRTAEAEDRQRQMRLLDEDRAAVLAERAKLETMARLQNPRQSGGGSATPLIDGTNGTAAAPAARVELEAAIQVAQEAGRQCDVERERLLEAQRKCEQQRRGLIDRERELRDRQIAAETAEQTAVDRERTAAAKLAACRTLEQQLVQKMRTLQQSGAELQTREARVSQERFDLSRERLEVQTLRRRVFQSRCSLCKIGERSQELGEMLMRSGVTVGGSLATMGVAKLMPEKPELGGFEANGGIDAILDRDVCDELDKMKRFEVLPDGEAGSVRELETLTSGGETGFLDAELIMRRIEALETMEFLE